MQFPAGDRTNGKPQICAQPGYTPYKPAWLHTLQTSLATHPTNQPHCELRNIDTNLLALTALNKFLPVTTNRKETPALSVKSSKKQTAYRYKCEGNSRPVGKSNNSATPSSYLQPPTGNSRLATQLQPPTAAVNPPTPHPPHPLDSYNTGKQPPSSTPPLTHPRPPVWT